MSDVNSHRLNRLFQVTGRPEYVKSAADQTHSSDCPEKGYADRTGHQYPCHTKEAAYCSAVVACEDRLDGKAISASVLTELEKFARFWGIEAEVKTAHDALTRSRHQVSLSELPEGDFALVQDHKGVQVRKYAAFDSESTVEAAIAFHENRHRYPFGWRKQASRELLTRADRFSAVLPEYVSEYLHKAAGFAVASPEAIEEALVQRLNLRSGEATNKLAEALNQVASSESLYSDQEILADVLTVMDEHDRETKLASFYGTRLGLPEEMLDLTLSRLTKMASDAGSVVRLTNGYSVNVKSIPHDTLETIGEGMSGMSLDKLAAVLPTLPRPDADLLVRLLPKHAAEMSNSLTDDNFADQAAASSAPAATNMAAAPMAAPAAQPMAQPLTAAHSVDIASGDTARMLANNVGHNQAQPVSAGQAAATQASNAAAVQHNGLGTSHGVLK